MFLGNKIKLVGPFSSKTGSAEVEEEYGAGQYQCQKENSKLKEWKLSIAAFQLSFNLHS